MKAHRFVRSRRLVLAAVLLAIASAAAFASSANNNVPTSRAGVQPIGTARVVCHEAGQPAAACRTPGR